MLKSQQFVHENMERQNEAYILDRKKEELYFNTIHIQYTYMLMA